LGNQKFNLQLAVSNDATNVPSREKPTICLPMAKILVTSAPIPQRHGARWFPKKRARFGRGQQRSGF